MANRRTSLPGLRTGAETKMERLRSLLKERIDEGRYAPDEKIESERDLADAFNVSRLTINKVLSMLVAEGCLRREPGRGTFVNAARPASVRPGPTHRLGFIFGESINALDGGTFYGRLLGAAFAEASRHGYRLLLENGDAANRLVAGTEPEVDGLLATVVGEDAMVAEWRTLGVPVVLCDYEDQQGICDSVVFDHEAAGRMMVDHLVSKGHRRIGFINESSEPGRADQVARAREASLRGALAVRGIELREADVLRLPYASPRFADPLRAFLIGPDRPDAIVLFDNRFARALDPALQHAGLSCPRDVAVVSFFTEHEAPRGLPVIAGARYSLEAMGSLAAGQLIRHIQRPEQGAIKLTIPPEFITGASV